MESLLIGTSGYSYTEWVGPVYPPGSTAQQYLSLYASLFSTVELNFSYYRMPTAPQLLEMAQQAPLLIFSIKAHREMTHTIDPSCTKEVVTSYRTAVQVLQERDQLGAILLQFPASFHYEPERRKYVHTLVKELKSFPLAVEFRNSKWYNNRTLDALRERNIALASLDLPHIQGNPPLIDVATSSIAYIRFHGRNAETWWGSDAASRYDYLYSDKELSVLAKRVENIVAHAEKTFVYFNNHRRGQAVTNAKQLSLMIHRST